MITACLSAIDPKKVSMKRRKGKEIQTGGGRGIYSSDRTPGRKVWGGNLVERAEIGRGRSRQNFGCRGTSRAFRHGSSAI